MKKITCALLAGVIITACVQPLEAYAQARAADIVVTVIAGNGKPGYSNGPAAEAGLFYPMGMVYGANGQLYFADNGNNLIRKVEEAGVSDAAGRRGVRNLYGDMIGGYVDEKAEKALFQKPTDVAYRNGAVYVADSLNHSIRRIEQGRVYTLAGGNGSGYADGNPATAKFDTPQNLAVDENGNIYVADTGNHVIRKIDASGKVTTAAGVGGTAGYQDGAAGAALFNQPMGLAIHGGSIYVADSANNRIRKIENGTVTTVAGAGTEIFEETGYYVGGYLDGAALTARFNCPTSLAFHADGSLYIADTDNSMIRKLHEGQVTTVLSTETVVNNNPKLIQRYLAQPADLIAGEKELIISDSFTQYIYSITLE